MPAHRNVCELPNTVLHAEAASCRSALESRRIKATKIRSYRARLGKLDAEISRRRSPLASDSL